MNRQRFNLTLAPRTIAALREVGNASRYVDALVAQHDRRWRQALRGLRGKGWTLAEIRQGLASAAGGYLDPRRGGPNGRRLAVLADELAAGNDELQRALNALETPAEVRA